MKYRLEVYDRLNGIHTKQKFYDNEKSVKRYLKYFYNMILRTNEDFEFTDVSYNEKMNAIYCEYEDYRTERIHETDFNSFVDKAIEMLLKNGTLCFGMKYTYGFYEFMIKKED